MSQLDTNIGHYRRYNKTMMRKLTAGIGYSIELCRYDNLMGVFGWFWTCKVKGLHYQTPSAKKGLFTAFRIFDKYVLPIQMRIESVVSPPVGLHLTTVLRKPQ